MKVASAGREAVPQAEVYPCQSIAPGVSRHAAPHHFRRRLPLLCSRWGFPRSPSRPRRPMVTDRPIVDDVNPYYPHRDFPKLITPQWVGEPGVEAVVVLAIDDMRDTGKVRSFPPSDPEPAQRDRRPGAGQHHDQPGRPQRPAAPGVARGRALARMPHA